MLIETAIVAPILLLMSMGAFQISSVIAHQSELQSAAAEGAAIALANAPDTLTERNTLNDIIVASTGLTDAQVTITQQFRCGGDSAYLADSSTCNADDEISSYVLINLTDTYTPAWTEWGFGSPITYNVNRYVMLRQA
jgi:Flp pilus assembly protein TadG